MTQEKIDRINALARKQRAEGLTDEERREQFRLRREYIEAIKNSLTAQLESTVIVEPDGTERRVKRRDEAVVDRHSGNLKQ